uniref:hypothetical protein n=1 Tax=Thiolapillus sp. TaxID=2017437 RepID=UPI003AF45AA6
TSEEKATRPCPQTQMKKHTYDSVSKGGVRSMMQVLKIKFVCDTDFLMYILPVVCVFSKNYQKNLVVHVKVDLFQLF